MGKQPRKNCTMHGWIVTRMIAFFRLSDRAQRGRDNRERWEHRCVQNDRELRCMREDLPHKIGKHGN
jgi:hypothetical protein